MLLKIRFNCSILAQLFPRHSSAMVIRLPTFASYYISFSVISVFKFCKISCDLLFQYLICWFNASSLFYSVSFQLCKKTPNFHVAHIMVKPYSLCNTDKQFKVGPMKVLWQIKKCLSIEKEQNDKVVSGNLLTGESPLPQDVIMGYFPIRSGQERLDSFPLF